ncbi:MAG: peptidylprolyl isomerase [Rhodospirillaceae bacterium]|jgi:FKBP-type peptidyl-prolyl cis-trans isomerase SlyD|nr:peptidylprolyl isomerase [Rhodospirillaceae bacterium]
MSETIQDNMYVELTYQVIDQKSGDVLVGVEFPIGYIQGANDILAPAVSEELAGRSAGDIVEVPVECDKLYGPRDESLVFTDYIDNVPAEYREVGTTIVAENEKGEPRSFIVTRMDDKTLTVDGNNPLSGRQVIFKLEVINVRDATDEEISAGGAIGAEPEIDTANMIPIG